MHPLASPLCYATNFISSFPKSGEDLFTKMAKITLILQESTFHLLGSNDQARFYIYVFLIYLFFFGLPL